MKQFGLVTLISVMASAAAPVSSVRGERDASFSTARSVEQFGGCFVNAQDRARRAWSFVPKGNGGTFSNAGAHGVRNPYFLSLSDRGSTREIRLERASAGAAFDPRIAQAVDQCI
jgi:hypothetical protein